MTAHCHQLQFRGKGRHNRLLLTPTVGLGNPGVNKVLHPTPPFPLGSHHRASHAHTAPHLLDTQQGPEGPSPDSDGDRKSVV